MVTALVYIIMYFIESMSHYVCINLLNNHDSIKLLYDIIFQQGKNIESMLQLTVTLIYKSEILK